jgi:hypothetical protein
MRPYTFATMKKKKKKKKKKKIKNANKRKNNRLGQAGEKPPGYKYRPGKK